MPAIAKRLSEDEKQAVLDYIFRYSPSQIKRNLDFSSS